MRKGLAWAMGFAIIAGGVSGDVGITDLILSLVHPNIIAAAANMKLLPVIVFCIVFAAALSTLGERGRPVVAFFEGLNEAMMIMVHWIMLFAPVGVFALIASRLGAVGGGEAFMGAAWRAGQICAGCHFRPAGACRHSVRIAGDIGAKGSR